MTRRACRTSLMCWRVGNDLQWSVRAKAKKGIIYFLLHACLIEYVEFDRGSFVRCGGRPLEAHSPPGHMCPPLSCYKQGSRFSFAGMSGYVPAGWAPPGGGPALLERRAGFFGKCARSKLVSANGRRSHTTARTRHVWRSPAAHQCNLHPPAPSPASARSARNR